MAKYKTKIIPIDSEHFSIFQLLKSHKLDEIKTTLRLYPDNKNYLSIYDKYELLSDKTLLAHSIHLETDEIEKIKDGPQGEWNQLDSLVLRATDELHAEKQISEETWTSLLEFWSEQQLMDLVFAVGQYTLVSMALKTFGVPLDDFLTGWDPA